MDKDHSQTFEQLFKTYFTSLTHFAIKYLGDMDDAKNLVHEVYIALWEKYDDMEVNSNFKSYLYTAVRNRCLNAIRDRKKVVELNVVDKEKQVQESDDLEVNELAAEIDFAINSLPEKCRMVFEMSRKEELKYAEIAEKMNISVKTVEAQMSKALKLMREHLADFLSLLFFLLFN